MSNLSTKVQTVLPPFRRLLHLPEPILLVFVVDFDLLLDVLYLSRRLSCTRLAARS